MSQHALYHRVSRCQIPFARQDRSLFFDRHALDRWMSKGVKHGFTEERRSLVLPENDQRPVVPRVHGFADKKAAERRANEIEFDIRAGVHGWKSTIPSFAEWWAVYRKTYTPLKSARNRDAQIIAHFLPHFDAKGLDEITKSDIVRYLNLRRTDDWQSGTQEAPPGVGKYCAARARTAPVDLREGDRRRLRHPQPVPRD